MVTAPILSYPDPNRPYTFDTNAGGVEVGAILSLLQGDRERLVVY